jgi:hypothetical protein
MKTTHITVVLAGLVLLAAGCSGASSASPVGDTISTAEVARAAGLAWNTTATCGQPDSYGESLCQEHPQRCGIPTDGIVDGSVADAGCWQISCTVELGVTATRGDGKVEDFYSCDHTVAGCSSMTGGCPFESICVIDDGKGMTVDEVRTGEWEIGDEFSCPYHDED